MRTTLVILAITVFATLLLLIGGERWDEQKNRGYTWGYWGEFNTVSNCLSKLPGVTVVKTWRNADFLALEEFGFDILAQGREVKLAFGEHDPIRGLSGRNLQKALTEIIRKQSSNHSIQRMGASRSAQSVFAAHWRLARTADAER